MHPARQGGQVILAPCGRDIDRWQRVASDLRELLPFLDDRQQNAADVAQSALDELAATYRRPVKLPAVDVPAVDGKTMSVGS